MKVAFFLLTNQLFIPRRFRMVRDPGPPESVTQFLAGSSRNRFRSLTRAMGISTNSSAVFHWLLLAASAAAVLMEGWELTPRGLPVLLSLFMSDDIATLLTANPKVPQCSLSSLLSVRGQTSVFRKRKGGKYVLRNEIR